MPLTLTKEIREIILDLIRLKYQQGNKLTENNLKDRSLKSLSTLLIFNLQNQTYAHEIWDGITSISLAWQRGSENLAVAVGALDPLKNDQPVHSETPYNISSISKFVLMVMCCRLYQEDRISIDGPVSRYISEAGLPHLEEITLSHLLSHRSGFKDRAFVNFAEHDSLSSFIKRKGDDFDLAGEPGERFYYANINYILVAKIIMATMKMNLSECLNELITKPLGLKGLTVITESKTDDNPPARGYQPDKEAKMLQDASDNFMFGATGLRATPSALTRLISAFFSDEFIENVMRKKILDSIQDEIFEVVTSENTYRWPTKIGIGIEEVPVHLENGETIRVYGHGGWQNSHASFMVFDPQDGSAYACCFSKTFGLEKIYQSRLRQAWENYQYPLFKEPGIRENIRLPLMGLGCVHLRDENSDIIDAALKMGITFFDTAECYGDGSSESALGKKLNSQPREKIFISSKCGVRFSSIGPQLSGTREYIREACEASLKRLQTSYLDLYYLHRIDPKTPIETSVAALSELVKEKKIRYIGLSEVTVEQLRRAHEIHPIAAIQIEYSPWSLQDEENGLIATCQRLGIALIAYSPLGRSFFTNIDEHYFTSLPANDLRKSLPRYNGEALNHNINVRHRLDEVATANGCHLSQLVLAWIMSKGLYVIPGTTNMDHLKENLGALLVKISDEEYEKLDRLILSLKFSGERYPSSYFSGIFPEQTPPATKSAWDQWMPSNKQAIGLGFLTIGGLFAYNCLRKSPADNTLAMIGELTKPRAPS